MRNKNITDKLNMSVIFDKRLNTSINKSIHERPTSVNMTRLLMNPKISRNTNQEYPSIFQQNSFIIENSPNYNFIKSKHIPSIVDKEKLYQDNINLKNIINNLKQELANSKSDVHKREIEISKKNKEIEEIKYEINLNVNSGGIVFNDNKLQNKIKESSLINNLKIQLSEVKNELKNKNNEIELLKKSIKVTKISELSQELKLTLEQFKKFKDLYVQAEIRSNEATKLLEDNIKIREQYNKLQNQYMSVCDSLRKTEEQFKIKELDILKLRQILMTKESLLLKSKNERMGNLSQNDEPLNKKFINHLDENKNVSSKKKSMNQNLIDLSKDCIFYKELNEKKEIIIKDMEKLISGEFSKNYDDNIQIDNQPKTNFQEDINLENREVVSLNAEKEDENDLKAFTYILLKNFQAMNMEIRKLIGIFDVHPNKNCIDKDIANRFCLFLKIKNNNEKLKIYSYLSAVFKNEKNFENLRNKFISLFYTIPIYTKRMEEYYQIQIHKELTIHKEYFKNTLLYYDKEKTGFITFHHLKRILDIINIQLKSEYVEYLIYFMKDFENTESTLLEELKYQKLLDLLHSNINCKNDKDDIMEKISTNYENLQEATKDNQSGEIIISNNEYFKRLESIFSKLSNILNKNKKTVKQFFINKIFSKDIGDNVSIESISLNIFIQELIKFKIEVDNIDTFCIYNKLKYSDDYESIDVNKLIEEMIKYGINDLSILESLKCEEDNLLLNKLNKFLLNNNLEIEEIFKLKTKKAVIFNQEEHQDVIEFNDFMKILKGFKIIIDQDKFTDNFLKFVCDKNKNYVLLNNLIEYYDKLFPKQISNLYKTTKNSFEELQTNDINLNNENESKNNIFYQISEEISENLSKELNSSHKENSKQNFPLQNIQSFAFEQKPTFGDIMNHNENYEKIDDENLNESYQIDELEMELKSEDEKKFNNKNY